MGCEMHGQCRRSPTTCLQIPTDEDLVKRDAPLCIPRMSATQSIGRFSTDGWGAYARHLDTAQHQVGKEHTQKIASKHLTLQTRLKRCVRRTICFSKTERMHD